LSAARKRNEQKLPEPCLPFGRILGKKSPEKRLGKKVPDKNVLYFRCTLPFGRSGSVCGGGIVTKYNFTILC